MSQPESVEGNQIFVIMNDKGTGNFHEKKGFLITVPEGAKFSINKGPNGEFELVPEPNTPMPSMKVATADDVKTKAGMPIYDYSKTKPSEDEAVRVTGKGNKIELQDGAGKQTLRFDGPSDLLAYSLIPPFAPSGTTPVVHKP